MARHANDEAAVTECLELAEAMTLKASAAGLDLGGGWSILVDDPTTERDIAGLRAHGQLIGTLGGRFVPVNDVGTTQSDIAVIGEETSPVCADGDPSPWTALGVYSAIEASVRHLGMTNLAGVHVVVQGVGNVGSSLVHLLVEADAVVTISDTQDRRVRSLRAALPPGRHINVIPPSNVVGTKCDVLAPCALGDVVTPETVDILGCKAIAGGANNVLRGAETARALFDRGIVYAPDFCANAGGLVFLQEKLRRGTDEDAPTKVTAIGEVIAEIIRDSERRHIPTTVAAVERAQDRLTRAATALQGN